MTDQDPKDPKDQDTQTEYHRIVEPTARVRQGRGDLLKLIEIANEAFPGFKRLSVCGELSPTLTSSEWRDWSLHGDGSDEENMKSSYRRDLFELADKVPWSASVLIYDGDSGRETSLFSFLTATDMINSSSNRVVLRTSSRPRTEGFAEKMLDMGVSVLFDNQGLFPDDTPREIPSGYFSSVLASKWSFANLSNNTGRRSSFKLSYDGPMTRSIKDSELLLAQRLVLFALNPMKIPVSSNFFNPSVTRARFEDLISAITFGNEDASNLSGYEEPAIEPQLANNIVGSIDMTNLAEKSDVIAAGLDLAKRMGKIALIWRYFMEENCILPNYPSDSMGEIDADADRYFFNRLSNIASSIGVDSAIEAFYAGVPIEDILL